MKVKKKCYLELQELKGRIRAKGMTYEEVADKLDMGVNTFSNKINGHTAFRINEIDELIKILDIKPWEIQRYFFPEMLRNEK